MSGVSTDPADLRQMIKGEGGDQRGRGGLLIEGLHFYVLARTSRADDLSNNRNFLGKC